MRASPSKTLDHDGRRTRTVEREHPAIPDRGRNIVALACHVAQLLKKGSCRGRKQIERTTAMTSRFDFERLDDRVAVSTVTHRRDRQDRAQQRVLAVDLQPAEAERNVVALESPEPPARSTDVRGRPTH